MKIQLYDRWHEATLPHNGEKVSRREVIELPEEAAEMALTTGQFFKVGKSRREIASEALAAKKDAEKKAQAADDAVKAAEEEEVAEEARILAEAKAAAQAEKESGGDSKKADLRAALGKK